jgi:uncharacterized membrane protein YphA (DoxX/SURF4 family)
VIILLAILLIAGSTVISAWGVMLLVGILHHDWWPAIPPMSFNTALLVCTVLVLFALMGNFVPSLLSRD